MVDCGTIWQAAAGLQPPPPPISEFKNTDFADGMISKILCDLPFSQKRPLKSGDELIKADSQT